MAGLGRNSGTERKLIARLCVVAAVFVLGGCASRASEPAATPHAAPQLSLRLLMRTAAGTERPVELGQPVFTGDQLALELSVDGARHLQVLAGTRLALVHEGPAEPGQAIRIPAGDDWLPLGGPEAVYRLVVIAANEPLADSAARARAEAARERADLDERIIAIDPAYAAHRGPGGTQIAGPRRTFRLRGPWLAEDDRDGAMRSESYDDGEPLVVELRVQTDR